MPDDIRPPLPGWAQLGATSCGLWTRSAALAVMSRGRLQRFVDRGDWQSPLPGVFADRGHQLDAEQWAMATVLATGGEGQPVPMGEPDEDGVQRLRMRAIACGRDAARVWGMPLIDDADPATGADERLLHDVHVWGRGLAPMRGREVDAHTVTRHRLRVKGSEIRLLPSGLYLTDPLTTAVHCCALLSFEAAVSLLDFCLYEDLLTREQLDASVTDRAGHPGVQALRAAVAAADGRSESPNETLARLILKPAIPTLEPQVKVRNHRGFVVARGDLGDEEVTLLVDMDGKRWHSGAQMVAKDRRRDGTTELLGWKTERGVWFDVRRRQNEFRSRIVATHAALRAAA